jgi:hypothetical protein
MTNLIYRNLCRNVDEIFNHEYGNCNYCKNNGFCLCPKSSSGFRCELMSENYFISLDPLVRIEMKKGETSFIYLIIAQISCVSLEYLTRFK